MAALDKLFFLPYNRLILRDTYLIIQDKMDNKATAIEKTLEILLAFSPHNRPIGTSELSKKLGFHKATTSRILLTLAEYGFVHQDPDTKQFSLGEKIYELGMVLAETSINKIVRVAQPYVDALCDELDETIVLEVWSGNSTVAAYEAENTRPIRVAGRVGKVPPIHVAAGAKAILSVTEPARVEVALNRNLRRYTPNTITDPEVFKKRLVEYKQRGFAVDNEELDIGISAVGAPIFNHEDKAIAAIVIITPTPRFTDDPESKTITALKTAVEAISSKFFHRNDHNSMGK